ncbi:MAG: TonB-dependent receptor [Lewinellaceae bacterium]|nr:TonB-dependent receptor [Lewinellaceae bacterium]
MVKLMYSFTFLLLLASSQAQPLSQTIRGVVVDQDATIPLIGANIVVLDVEPLLGSSTGADGEFRIEKVPVGRISLLASYLGYEDKVIPNIEVSSAKEVVLQIELTESATSLEEVVVVDKQPKTEVMDEMALVSARSVTVEETNRYAGALNDPARMVSAFAGVSGTAYGGNEIVVRGNSPRGILWRLEGVEIPNPNHFADEGSTGGPINALNSNMLANSDFFTSAFAPEYGNAYSGVFDIRLRRGNNEHREYTLQAGVIGLEATLEGPFKKGYNGSYLFNYRYSTLALLDGLGFTDYGGVPKYQDLSFLINLPTEKAGRFTLFGLAGKSSILSELSDEDLDGLVVESHDVQAELGVVGLNHNILFNDRAYLQSSLSLSENGSGVLGEKRNTEDDFYLYLDNKLQKWAAQASTNLHIKFDARNKLQAGLTYTRLFYNFRHDEWDYESGQMVNYIDTDDGTGLLQGYASWKHRFNERLTAVGGLHYMNFTFNGAQSVEPRISFSWQQDSRHRFFGGYGKHSRLAPITEYLARETLPDGSTNYYNENLELIKAHHFVLGYDFLFSPNAHLKLEAYYQYLYDVPVGATPGSTYSSLNDFGSFTTERLVNEGTGRNYGLELTLERFFSEGFYYLVTGSLYDSRFTAADGVERDTRYNARFASNLVLGKEFQLNGAAARKRTLGVNTRIYYAGGSYFTPIDLEASIAKGNEVRYDALPFSTQGDNIFRLDLSITYRINRPKTTQYLKLEAQNLTMHDALVEQYYNGYSKKTEEIRQLPVIPVVLYGVSF